MGSCDVLCRVEVYCGDVVMLVVFCVGREKGKVLEPKGSFRTS